MPRFSLEVTPAVKKEEGWEVTALATVLYGNRPPDPPEEIVFVVSGEEFERTETNPESGIARSVMILQSGGYVVTAIRSRARADDRDARRTRSFAIREERELTEDEKKLAGLKAEIKLAEAEKELERAKQGPTPEENEVAALKTMVQLIGARKDLKETVEGKPRIPKNILVSVSGVPGNQKFLISIAAEDGTLISNQPFTLVDGDRVANHKTGKNGVATYKADFTEPSRYFEVRAGNTKDLVWQEQVPGPPAEPIQPGFREAPDPPDYFEKGRTAARRHFRKPQPVN